MKFSKTIQELFAAHPWCDKERQKRLVKQLKGDYDRIIGVYSRGTNPITVTGDKEKDGISVLECYLRYNHPDEDRKRREVFSKRVKARYRHKDAFHKIFGARLYPCYWQHDFIGFDLVKFDKEIVKSRKNESVLDAVRRQYGELPAQMIIDFID